MRASRCAQRLDADLELFDLVLAHLVAGLDVAGRHCGAAGLQLASRCRSSRLESEPIAMRRPIAPRIERTHVQVGRRAVGREAGAVALPLGRFGQLRARQVGQRQVFEEDLHELFLAQVKDEIVLALARVARLAVRRRRRRRPSAARCGRRARIPCCPGARSRARRPGAWPNTGSAMSCLGMRMSSPCSMSRMPRPSTARFTASRICSL